MGVTDASGNAPDSASRVKPERPRTRGTDLALCVVEYRPQRFTRTRRARASLGPPMASASLERQRAVQSALTTGKGLGIAMELL
jgi:hypothetical protein